jgi:uncharacterized SAM-binding protein YcdF (DUF218 family)
VIILTFAAVGLFIVVITFSPLVEWWGTQLAGPWKNPRGEVLIVLGGSILEDGIIGQNSYLRSVYAARAYREGTFVELVISGGGRDIPVAAPMRDYLQCAGIPPSAIRLETSSTSTRENALFSKPILEGMKGRKVLLTSDYHMFRAIRSFRKVGLQILPRPIPDVTKRASTYRERWPAFLDLVQESFKILYYFAHGWI